jgi:antitoxin component of MazEF toxin-antitoxin module
MQTHIVAIGNSFGLRLPKPVLDALQLEKASPLLIELRKGSIVLSPAPKVVPKPATKPVRVGWFDEPFDAALDNGVQQEWHALDAALLNDAALDAEWQW